MQNGFRDAFGFDPAVTEVGGNNALALQGNGATTFDLTTLNRPHLIEHDASLTREDAQMAYDQNGDNHDFNATIWNLSLDFYGPGPHIDAASANTARLGRVAQARQQDFPGWFLENAAGSLAEHGFILTSMNDPTVGTPDHLQARLDWVDYWFTNQRLPTDLGWVRPSAISNDLFNAAVAAVSNALTTSPLPRSTTAAPGTSTTTSPDTRSTSLPGTTTESTQVTTSSTVSSTSPPLSHPEPSSSQNSTTKAPYPLSNTTALSPTTTPHTTPITSLPSLPASVTSSAVAVATSLAGPPPAVPCGYTQEVSSEGWKQVEDAVCNYVNNVESIVAGLCGVHGVGAMPMPGAEGSTSGAPWFGAMDSQSSTGEGDKTCQC